MSQQGQFLRGEKWYLMNRDSSGKLLKFINDDVDKMKDINVYLDKMKPVDVKPIKKPVIKEKE